MRDTERDPKMYEGLHRDTLTGDYRVEPGYGYQAHRYRIHETFLDEDDNLWIQGDAVERVAQEVAAERSN